jgi:hypothetical protein
MNGNKDNNVDYDNLANPAIAKKELIQKKNLFLLPLNQKEVQKYYQ